MLTQIIRNREIKTRLDNALGKYQETQYEYLLDRTHVLSLNVKSGSFTTRCLQ